MGEIDAEVAEIVTRFSNRQQHSSENHTAWRVARRLEVRDKLRAGELPDHLNGECTQCVRGILELDHDSACDYGKRFPYLIIPQSNDQG